MTERVVESVERRVPEYLTGLEQWVLWDGETKVPLAPWATGDMFPAGWGDGVVADPTSRMQERPETGYKTAKRFAEARPEVLHFNHPFPSEDGEPQIPDRLIPTVLLPHYPPNPPLMQVDFDDVRDPETGRVSREVGDLIDALDAFTEISISGEGLHMYVRAELPGQLGKFIADLDGPGAIELYDHGRFTACTWDHVSGTPVTVPERQDVIDKTVEMYECESQKHRRCRDPEPDSVDDVLASIRGTDESPSSENAYHRLDCRQVADGGYFGSYRRQAPGDEWTGPHPEHGPQHSDYDDCSNFAVDPGDNVWYCRAHDVGGGPLSLVAVLAEVVDCGDARQVYRDNGLLLKSCLHARDEYSAELDEEDPPYGALIALAKRHELVMADPEAEILGEDAWRIARIIYENSTTDDC